jgi:hypothetical protein
MQARRSVRGYSSFKPQAKALRVAHRHFTERLSLQRSECRLPGSA